MEPVADGSIVKATFTTNDIAIEGISTSSATTPTTTEKHQQKQIHKIQTVLIQLILQIQTLIQQVQILQTQQIQ